MINNYPMRSLERILTCCIEIGRKVGKKILTIIRWKIYQSSGIFQKPEWTQLYLQIKSSFELRYLIDLFNKRISIKFVQYHFYYRHQYYLLKQPYMESDRPSVF